MLKKLLILYVLCTLFGCGEAVAPDPTPAVPTICAMTANDWKVGVALSECQASDLAPLLKGGVVCYRCFAEFVTPPEGCFTYPGTTASRLCVVSCSDCAE